MKKLLLSVAVAVAAVLGACADKKIEVDYNFGGVSSLLGVKKFVTTPSTTQSLTASSQISADAAVVRAQTTGCTPSKTTSNTTAVLVSCSGVTTYGNYNLRATSDGGGPPSVNYYWNTTACASCPYSGWPTEGTQIAITNPTAGVLTFTTGNIAGQNQDQTDVITLTESSPNTTITATPSIAAGADGQHLLVQNVGTGSITLQDRDTLSGSNLELVSPAVALSTGDTMSLTYSSNTGAWVQSSLHKSWVGSENISKLGTVTTGTYNAGAVTSSGPILINGSAAYGPFNEKFESNTITAGQYGGISLNNWNTTGGIASGLVSQHSKSGTIGNHTALALHDGLGNLIFRGSDGTSFNTSVQFLMQVDGAVSTGIVPGRIVIQTANSSGANTEALRIDSSQNLQLGGAITSGTWNAGAVTSSGGISGTTGTFSGSVTVTKLTNNGAFVGKHIFTTGVTYTPVVTDWQITIQPGASGTTIDLPAGAIGQELYMTRVNSTANTITLDPQTNVSVNGDSNNRTFGTAIGYTVRCVADTTSSWQCATMSPL